MKSLCKTLRSNFLLWVTIPALWQSASAATVFSETFEAGTNAFGLPTYGYSENYTLANTLTPSSGSRYAHGGNPAGANGITFAVSFSAPELSLAGLGYSNASIDSGTLTLSLAGQFSTYQSQNDFAVVSVQFLDGVGANLGTAVEIGGSGLVSGLAGGTGSRGWANASQDAAVPTGARSMVISVSENKTPQGAYIDGYVDNVTVAIIPEPSSLLLGFATALPLFMRRRR